jgi:hypothetical protein
MGREYRACLVCEKHSLIQVHLASEGIAFFCLRRIQETDQGGFLRLASKRDLSA